MTVLSRVFGPAQIIRPSDLNTVLMSAPFTLLSVGAQFGPGGDNVLTLRGINYNASGGGNYMGMDFHQLEVAPPPVQVPTLTEWVMISLSLLMLGLGGFWIRRRKLP